MNEATLLSLAKFSRATRGVISTRKICKNIANTAGSVSVRMPVTMGPATFPMRLYPSDYVDFQLYYFGEYEKDEGGIFTSLLKPGDVMFDIGANIGYYTLAAAHLVGETGQVHAFEPVPDTHHRLAANVEMNALGNIVVNQCAISDQRGQIEMHLFSQHSGGSSFGTDTTSTGSVTVQTLTLDEYVQTRQIKKIDVMKMDIEGAEVLALRGMRETLTRFRPHLLVELNPPLLAPLGFTVADLVRTLQDYGYTLIDVETRQPLDLTDLESIKRDVHAIPEA